MARRARLLLLVGMSAAAGCGLPNRNASVGPAIDGPSLVVMVTVDQLRSDMLVRYDALFTGGFRRLLDEGHRFVNATQDHAETSTAPGHATLATGVYPSRHGVVGNNWSERSDGDWMGVYSVEDLNTDILGFPGMAGRSPMNIRRDGLPDWIAAAHSRSRIVSISQKDRAAIPLAARAAGEVYWLASSVGRFVTSSFYRSEYPDWVQRFNDREMPPLYSQTVWQNSTPVEHYGLSRPDTSAYELDGVHTFFPHRASDLADITDSGQLNRWRYNNTPFADAAVLELALVAIDELELGQRSAVDYLGLSFSQTDLVGHRFGPFSREQLDNLLLLDGLLGKLFASLDGEVGEGSWVLALSADHGVLEIPEHLAENGEAAARMSSEERSALRETIARAADGGLDGVALAESLKESLSALPFVASAYTFEEVERADAYPDSFALLFGRSHSRERVVEFSARYGSYYRLPPNRLEGRTGTSHGSPYYYDRAVPMFFLGRGVRAGASNTRAATVDVAPTLAALAGIEAPNDLDGRDLRGNLSP